MSQFTKAGPLVADEDNPWKRNQKLGKIPEVPEIVKIKQGLQELQRQAVNAGIRNPLLDLMIRLARQVEELQ